MFTLAHELKIHVPGSENRGWADFIANEFTRLFGGANLRYVRGYWQHPETGEIKPEFVREITSRFSDPDDLQKAGETLQLFWEGSGEHSIYCEVNGLAVIFEPGDKIDLLAVFETAEEKVKAGEVLA